MNYDSNASTAGNLPDTDAVAAALMGGDANAEQGAETAAAETSTAVQETETTQATETGDASQEQQTQTTESEQAEAGEENPFGEFDSASKLLEAYNESKRVTGEQGNALGQLRDELGVYRGFLPLLEALAKRPDVAEALRTGKDIKLDDLLEQEDTDPRIAKLQETHNQQSQILQQLNGRMQVIQQREVQTYLNDLEARVVGKYKDLDQDLLTLVSSKVQQAQQMRVAQGLQMLPLGTPEFERLVMDRAAEVNKLRQSFIDRYLAQRQQANAAADTVVPRGSAGDESASPPSTIEEATEKFHELLNMQS